MHIALIDDRTLAARIGICLLLAGSASCSQSQTPAPAADPPPPSQPATQPVFDITPLPTLIDLGYFQIVVPEGAVSRNDEFWKNVPDAAVDGEENRQLQWNGLRVGEGDFDHWKPCGDVLKRAGAQFTIGHFYSVVPSDQEIPVSGDIARQTLFWFDRQGRLIGEDYDHCQDILCYTFGPSSEYPGRVKLDLTPMVRAVRQRIEITALNNEQDIQFVSSQHLFDVGLSVDLPKGKFLVISPSADAQRETSIGHRFLTSDAHAGRRETIFVFVVNRTPPTQVTTPDGATHLEQ